MAVKHGLTFEMFKNVLLSLGNDAHTDLYFACENGEVTEERFCLLGCDPI